MLSKTALRQAFRTNLSRDDHDKNEIADAARALSERLTEFLKSQTGIWAGFEPVGFEPDIRAAIDSSTHLRWAYPRVESDPETTLHFYEVKTRADLKHGKFGIAEPDPATARRVQLNEITGLLVPGLAFDTQCNRLGRGKGYYDRALSETSTNRPVNKPLKIGIALERQVSAHPLPHDAHDIAMNLVITEKRTLKGSAQ